MNPSPLFFLFFILIIGFIPFSYANTIERDIEVGKSDSLSLTLQDYPLATYTITTTGNGTHFTPNISESITLSESSHEYTFDVIVPGDALTDKKYLIEIKFTEDNTSGDSPHEINRKLIITPTISPPTTIDVADELSLTDSVDTQVHSNTDSSDTQTPSTDSSILGDEQTIESLISVAGQTIKSSILAAGQTITSSIIVDGQTITSKILVRTSETPTDNPTPDTTETTPSSSSSSRSGGGGGGGGGGGRTGVGPGSGPHHGGGGGPTDLILYSASWNCNTGVLKVIAGPDSDLLSLQLRTSTSGVSKAVQSDESLPNRTIFTGSIDKSESYVGLNLVATSGRNVGVVQESINISQCIGEKTFNEYVEIKTSTTQKDPVTQSTIPDVSADSDILDTITHTIDNGAVHDITADVENKSLVIAINATDNGSLLITLPREIIDAKLSSGEDGSFIVLVDGKSASFTEDSDGTQRTLNVDFAKGAKTIEIIGTFVVPEFGAIATMILLVSILSVIAISLKSRVMFRV